MTAREERNKFQETILTYLDWFKKNCSLSATETATLHVLFSTSLHVLDDFLEKKV